MFFRGIGCFSRNRVRKLPYAPILFARGDHFYAFSFHHLILKSQISSEISTMSRFPFIASVHTSKGLLNFHSVDFYKRQPYYPSIDIIWIRYIICF